MRIIESYEGFHNTLAEALEGSRTAQGRIKDTIWAAQGGTQTREAVTADQVSGWFMDTVRPEFEKQYKDLPEAWREIATEVKFNDFRDRPLYEVDTDHDVLEAANGGTPTPRGTLPHIPELTPYPTMGYKASGKFLAHPRKHGARLHLSWEAFLNDQWDLVSEFPKTAAKMARKTIDAQVFGVLFDPAMGGFRADVISDANKTVLQARTKDSVLILEDVAKNAALSYEALLAAREQVSKTKVNGRQVRVSRFVLLVPPALKPLADALVGEDRVARIVGKAGSQTVMSTTNALKGVVKVVESEMMALLGGANADTAWCLVPAGGRTEARDTIVRTSLVGHETPDLRMASMQGVSIGGSSVSATSGSFDNDDLQTRVRVITGGDIINYDGIIASTGKGS